MLQVKKRIMRKQSQARQKFMKDKALLLFPTHLNLAFAMLQQPSPSKACCVSHNGIKSSLLLHFSYGKNPFWTHMEMPTMMLMEGEDASYI